MAAATTIIEMGDVDKMKVADLKKELKLRGLSTIGNKGDLVERLQLSLQLIAADTVGSDLGTEEEVNEDDVLGDADETLSEDQKGDSSLILIEDDIILSPTLKTAPQTLETGHSAPSLIRKKTATVAPITPAKPIIVTEAKLEVDIKASPVVVKSLSAQERIELRAKRFNVPAPLDTRKQARAERFGIESKTGQIKSTNGASLEKLQQRAERFGQVLSPSIKQMEEKNRLLKRKERFGAVIATSGKVEGDDKKMKRAERFGIN